MKKIILGIITIVLIIATLTMPVSCGKDNRPLEEKLADKGYTLAFDLTAITEEQDPYMAKFVEVAQPKFVKEFHYEGTYEDQQIICHVVIAEFQSNKDAEYYREDLVKLVYAWSCESVMNHLNSVENTDQPSREYQPSPELPPYYHVDQVSRVYKNFVIVCTDVKDVKMTNDLDKVLG